MTLDYWLGRQHADPHTDVNTWCLVKAGDPLLTRRAADLPGQDLMQTVMWGEKMSSTRAGRYVRPGDLAVVMVPNGLTAAKRDAARLAASPHLAPVDRCAVALAGPTPAACILIAEILAAAVDEPDLAAAWPEGARRAIATGAARARVNRHRAVAEGLNGRTPTVEEVAAWMALRLSTQRVRQYTAAGHCPADAQEIEQEGAYDPAILTALAAAPDAPQVA